MRVLPFVCTAVGLGLAGMPGLLRGDPGKEAEARRVAALIKQLGDDDFDQREAASKELQAIGKPALRALRDAAADSADPEVRQRAQLAFDALAARFPDVAQKAQEIRRTDWAGIHVYNTTFSPDGRLYLAGGDGGTLRLYAVDSGKLVHELAGHGGWTQQAVFTPDGKQILSASMDRTLRLWDVATGKEVRKLEGHEGGVLGVDVTRDGRWAVSGGSDKTLRLWEIATGKEVRKFEGHTSACAGLFTPDGRQVLSHSFDKTMRLWDAESGKELRTFAGHTAPLFGAFVLPGGRRALSYSADRTARVWDLATAREVSKLDLGDNLSDIRGLALAPDGKRILVGSDGRPAVRLIELITGKEIHRFELATNPRGLSFSSDGKLATGGSFRGVVYLWRMPGLFDGE
jgi:WD40 repeat protein